MKDIDKFRQEIKRLRQEIKDEKDPLAPNQKAGYLFALTDMESFLDTLSEEPVQKFNTDKLQEVAKPATPHKKPTPEDRAKFMEELHEYAESKKPDKSLEEAALSYVKNKYNFSSELVYNNIGTDDFIAGAEWQKSQMLKDAVEGKIAERVQGKLYARCQIPKTMGVEFGDKVRIVVLKEEE